MELTIEPPYLIVRPFATEDDFYREAGEDSDWEYLDGRIVMHSPASDRHEDTKTPAGYETRTIAEGRQASVVIPGFWIEVSWLWRETLPSTMGRLREVLAPEQ